MLVGDYALLLESQRPEGPSGGLVRGERWVWVSKCPTDTGHERGGLVYFISKWFIVLNCMGGCAGPNTLGQFTGVDLHSARENSWGELSVGVLFIITL